MSVRALRNAQGKGDRLTQGNSTVMKDVIVKGKITAQSGVTTDSSGSVLTGLKLIQQVIDFGAIGSGVTTIVHTPYTSGAAALIGSGDYLIALTQPVESGATIIGIPAASGGTISVKYNNETASDPAAQAYTFAVVKGNVIS